MINPIAQTSQTPQTTPAPTAPAIPAAITPDTSPVSSDVSPAVIDNPELSPDNSDAFLGALVDGNNAFGMDLFHRLGPTVAAGKNLVFSPYSIVTAMTMVWTGARNNTETQMAQALHFAGGRDTISGGFQSLQSSLNELGKENGFDFKVANSIWVQKDYKLLQPFLEGLKNDFDAPPNPVDFNNPATARLQINQWVEDKTNFKIKDLLGPGALDSQIIRMLLVNAVYFKADWLSAFKPADTQSLPFHTGADNASPVPMMQQQKDFMIAQDDTAQVLEMPYKGDELAMDVILPRAADGLPALEQKVSPDMLNTWFLKMSSQPVQVKLPKFKFTYGTVDLKPFLSDLGMAEAFDSVKGDFSGITGNKDFFIQFVMHKAFVSVDEKGTEAAAATAVGLSMASVAMSPPQPILFNADHPFLFLIRDKLTRNILFIGRVADPRLSE
jgi:serpin B